MDLLQREREAIVNNEYIDHFDFDESLLFYQRGKQRPFYLSQI